eukprot:CAMPEP_0171136818 /NCGR_PEP_ID=MMETSP0766_2-20121228/132221_1 /TAXON_ID=439317 /ORGANISM="Gambierdiscus australes, Strain CAWD 149" /LENGTH=97 /DNA_ID=CAMNT_0011600373 /DNA_START=229 /DNA_END=519 /DNA_ORIENTATION=+
MASASVGVEAESTCGASTAAAAPLPRLAGELALALRVPPPRPLLPRFGSLLASLLASCCPARACERPRLRPQLLSSAAAPRVREGGADATAAAGAPP